MPISFAVDGDYVVWTQQFASPTVYLDTYAIREISESTQLTTRFAEAIKRKNGTWLLAPLSMGEFAVFKDPRHCAQAEILLAQVVPHIYLFETKPLSEEGDGGLSQRSRPRPDAKNLDWFSQRFCQVGSLQDVFQGMFQLVHDRREEMLECLNGAALPIKATFERYRQAESYRANAKAAPLGNGRSRQFVIAGELSRDFVLDINANISRNDALDFMHAVDAVDYCDLVLLDKAWERRVNGLRKRIAEEGVDMPVARCFSKSNNGIETFLDAIERWPEASVSA